MKDIIFSLTRYGLVFFVFLWIASQGIHASDIAAGSSHTCAITNTHQLKCWGGNSSGQLGNGTLVASSLPVAVDTTNFGSATVQAVATGSYHSCLIDNNHQLYCWGWNGVGQLGMGNTSDLLIPTAVPGMSSVVFVTTQHGHTCAVKMDGTLWCWGENYRGQTGVVDSTGEVLTPTRVQGLTGGNVINVTAGTHHTCALVADGRVWCWGNNQSGELGTTVNLGQFTHIPQQVQGLIGTIAGLTAGEGFSCALTTLGQVYCWGANDMHQLGNTTPTGTSVPMLVEGLGYVSQFAASGASVCALSGARPWCWGDAHDGQLGTGTLSLFRSAVPMPVRDLDGVINLAMGAGGVAHVCAKKVTGELYCWGVNSAGELGNGSPNFRTAPVDVLALIGVSTVTSGAQHSCAVGNNNDGLWCWGLNMSGEVGDGTTQQRQTPTLVANTAGATITSADSSSHSCAIIDGIVKCWGQNTFGQLGNGTTVNTATPTAVQGSLAAVGVVTGLNHSCAFNAAGNVWCWGSNFSGKLGVGSTVDQTTPQAVVGLSNVTAMAAGYSHTCAIINNTSMACWGSNGDGQLGVPIGTYPSSTTPVFIANFSASRIVAGEGHTCALSMAGQVYCWGANNSGQYGFPSSPSQPWLRNLVPGLPTITTLSSKNRHVCALTASNTVWCWGTNSWGECGTGNNTSPATPQPVLNLTSVTAISAGRDHTCAVSGSGPTSAVKCWGSNFSGQLGNGETGIWTFPKLLDPQIIMGINQDPLFANGFEG